MAHSLPPALRRHPPPIFEGGLEIGSGRLQRRQNAEQDTGSQRRQHGKQQDPAVDAHVGKARQRGRPQGHQHPHAAERHDESRGPTQQGQDQTLGQELPDQSIAPGPQRAPNGHLALPHGGPGEEQARHVHARDEQDERDGPQQQQERRAHSTYRRVQHTLHPHAAAQVVVGVLLFEIGGDGGHVGVRALQRDTVGEPSDHAKIVIPAEPRSGPHLHRRPHLGTDRRIREAGRHHTDDLVGVSLDNHAPADDRLIRSESAGPKLIAQHHHWLAARSIVLRIIDTAEHRRHAEDAEQGMRRSRGTDHLRLGVSTGEGGADELPRREILEHHIPFEHVEIVGTREPLQLGATQPVVLPNHDQAVRPSVGQRAQQHAVHDAEDGGVGTNSEAQRQDHRRGEPGILENGPHGVPQVLSELCHDAVPLALSVDHHHCSTLRADSSVVAKATRRLAPRRRRAHAGRLQSAGPHLDVIGELAIDVLLNGLTANRGPQAEELLDHPDPRIFPTAAAKLLHSAVSLSSCLFPARLSR